jgi:hypothetical protein
VKLHKNNDNFLNTIARQGNKMFSSLRNGLVCIVTIRSLFVLVLEKSVPVFCLINVLGAGRSLTSPWGRILQKLIANQLAIKFATFQET